MDECIIKYPNLPDLTQLNPVFSVPEVETEVVIEEPIVIVVQEDSCSIKQIPSNVRQQGYTGNNGNVFPLTMECRITEKALNHDCYLALELGDDVDGDGDPLMQEDDLQMGDGRFAAPCMDDDPIFEECFLVKEEDGTTPLEAEENTNYFIVQCI